MNSCITEESKAHIKRLALVHLYSMILLSQWFSQFICFSALYLKAFVVGNDELEDESMTEFEDEGLSESLGESQTLVQDGSVQLDDEIQKRGIPDEIQQLTKQFFAAVEVEDYSKVCVLCMATDPQSRVCCAAFTLRPCCICFETVLHLL